MDRKEKQKRQKNLEPVGFEPTIHSLNGPHTSPFKVSVHFPTLPVSFTAKLRPRFELTETCLFRFISLRRKV